MGSRHSCDPRPDRETIGRRTSHAFVESSECSAHRNQATPPEQRVRVNRPLQSTHSSTFLQCCRLAVQPDAFNCLRCKILFQALFFWAAWAVQPTRGEVWPGMRTYPRA